MRRPAQRHGDPGWRHFERWCAERHLRALPAHPWTVAAYLRWCETRSRRMPVAARLKAIGRIHVLSGRPAPERHPIVERTLRLLERRSGTAGAGTAGLFKPDLGKGPAPARSESPAPDKRPASENRNGENPDEESNAFRRRALRRTPRLVRSPKRTH